MLLCLISNNKQSKFNCSLIDQYMSSFNMYDKSLHKSTFTKQNTMNTCNTSGMTKQNLCNCSQIDFKF